MITRICKLNILACMMLNGLIVLSFAQNVPVLKFQKIIGDMRGKGMQNLSVATDEQGNVYLLMLNGRISIFSKDGKYEKSFMTTLQWPDTYYYYLQSMMGRIFLGDYKKDYAWIFSPERAGYMPGKFKRPSMAITDYAGNQNVYVCDTGNDRIQIFSSDNHKDPKSILFLKYSPTRIFVRSPYLVVLSDSNRIFLYKIIKKGGKEDFELKASGNIDAGGYSVCLTKGNDILVAFNSGPDNFWLKKYTSTNDGKIIEVSTIAPSYLDQWPNFFPSAVPLITGPDGKIWFGTDLYDAVLSLNPATDIIKQRFMTGWRQDVALGFGPDNTIYTAGYPDSKGNLTIHTFKKELNGSIVAAGDFPSQKPLYNDLNVPIWGLLPTLDGKSIYVRVLNPQQGGWTSFTIYKVNQNGSMKPFYDFGQAYGKRTTFGPSGAVYSLQLYDKNSILLASIPTVSVLRISLDGKVLWEAGIKPSGGASKVNFGMPVETTIDSRGNIWVCDYDKNKIYCLSPEGKLLLEYGQFEGIDDTKGKGFDGPSGIAAVQVNGTDFLYVGDSGNSRLVKYKIEYTDRRKK